jgi:hypothetical protein
LKQTIARGAVALALALTAATASRAQPITYYPRIGMELPPHEIMVIVRSTGLDPVSRPVRRGPVYSLRALDRDGREVRVEVDRVRGHILRVAPVAALRYADIPPSYGRPPGLVPDGYDLDEPRAPSPLPYPPDYEDGPAASDRAPPGEPAAPERGSAGPRPAAQTVAPPLPRPRPRLAATHSPPAAEPAPAPPPRGGEQRENGTTGTLATSSSKPPWHGIEQQE